MFNKSPILFCLWTALLWTISATAQLRAQESIVLGFGQTGYDFLPIIEHFQRQTGITVISAPQEQYDLKAELVKRSNKKRLPDVFIAPADYTSIQNLALMEISQDWLDSNISPSALRTVTQKGRVNAIPLISGNHLVLYYNRSLVDSPARTFSELQQQRDSIPSDKYLINWAFSSMYVFIPFLSAFEALPITDDELTLDTPQMANALEFYWQLPEKGLVNLSCSYECMTRTFSEQKYAYVIDGVWAFKRFSDALGEELGVARLPSIQGRAMKPYFSSHALAVVQKSHSPEKLAAIKQFGLFLQSEYAQTVMWQETGAIPSNQVVFANLLDNANDNTKALLAQLDYSVPIPNTPYMTIVWEAMLKGFNRYGGQVMTASESATLMQHLAIRTIEN